MRLVTIWTYCRLTGLTYQEVQKALENGTLKGRKSRGNYWKVELPEQQNDSKVTTKSQQNNNNKTAGERR